MPNDRHSGKLQSRSPSGDPGTQANLKSQAMEMIDSIRLAWRSWVSVGVLAVLCGFLAILQYRWIGEVSGAERLTLQKDLETRLALLRRNFDDQIESASHALIAQTAEIEKLGRDEIDLVAFTSASQATNLFTVARQNDAETALGQSLARTRVASIGPVCSAALRKHGVRIDMEAHPPKLGPLIDAINRALSGANGTDAA